MKKMSKTIGIFILGVITSFAINVAAEAVISSGAVSYSNTTVSAALDELFSAVDINNKIGTTDISAIGDGTITGAVNTINDTVSELDSDLTKNNLSLYGDLPTNGHTSFDKVFVFPKDGYLYLYGGTTGTEVGIYGANKSGIKFKVPIDESSIISVKKGMTAYCTGGANAAGLYYTFEN